MHLATTSADTPPMTFDPIAFTDDENWHGGFYELAIELGDCDDERLQAALSALWQAADITGCYASRDREPRDQQQIVCTTASLATTGHLRGTVRLPDGNRVVCGVVAVREDQGPDWLDFYLPLGALTRVEPRVGAFPFDNNSGTASLAWRRPLDDWLAHVAEAVYDRVAFQLALVGFEMSGHTYAAQLNGTAPQKRWAGYLIPIAGKLHYSLANQ